MKKNELIDTEQIAGCERQGVGMREWLKHVKRFKLQMLFFILKKKMARKVKKEAPSSQIQSQSQSKGFEARKAVLKGIHSHKKRKKK